MTVYLSECVFRVVSGSLGSQCFLCLEKNGALSQDYGWCHALGTWKMVSVYTVPVHHFPTLKGHGAGTAKSCWKSLSNRLESRLQSVLRTRGWRLHSLLGNPNCFPKKFFLNKKNNRKRFFLLLKIKLWKTSHKQFPALTLQKYILFDRSKSIWSGTIVPFKRAIGHQKRTSTQKVILIFRQGVLISRRQFSNTVW